MWRQASSFLAATMLVGCTFGGAITVPGFAVKGGGYAGKPYAKTTAKPYTKPSHSASVGVGAAVAVSASVAAFTIFAESTGGRIKISHAPSEIPSLMGEIFDEGIPAGVPVDLMFVIDATGSMGDDIDAVRADMRAISERLSRTNPDSRIGVVAYRDRLGQGLLCGQRFESQTFVDLTDDPAAVEWAISSIVACGGWDQPEHVYAGLDTALRGQVWREYASQHIILMGDAPPHDDYFDDPRNAESVLALAHTAPLNVHIHAINVE